MEAGSISVWNWKKDDEMPGKRGERRERERERRAVDLLRRRRRKSWNRRTINKPRRPENPGNAPFEIPGKTGRNLFRPPFRVSPTANCKAVGRQKMLMLQSFNP